MQNKNKKLIGDLSKNAESVLSAKVSNKKFVHIEKMIGKADCKNWKTWSFK